MRSKWLGARLLSAVVVGMVMPAAALAAKPAATTGTPTKLIFQSVRLLRVGRSEQAADDLLLPVRHDDRARDADRAVPGRQRRQGRARPRRRHRPRAGDEVLLQARRPKRLGHGARQAALVHDQEAAARPVADRDAQPGGPAKNTATLVKGNLSGTGNAGPSGRPAVRPRGRTRCRVPERLERAGHGRERQLRVPAAERRGDAEHAAYRVGHAPRDRTSSARSCWFGVKPYVKSKVSKHRVQRGHLVRFSGTITPRAADQQVAFQKKHNGQSVTVGGDTDCPAASSPRTSGIRRGGTFRVWTGWSGAGIARRTSARRSRSRRSGNRPADRAILGWSIQTFFRSGDCPTRPGYYDRSSTTRWAPTPPRGEIVPRCAYARRERR